MSLGGFLENIDGMESHGLVFPACLLCVYVRERVHVHSLHDVPQCRCCMCMNSATCTSLFCAMAIDTQGCTDILYFHPTRLSLAFEILLPTASFEAACVCDLPPLVKCFVGPCQVCVVPLVKSGQILIIQGRKKAGCIDCYKVLWLQH